MPYLPTSQAFLEQSALLLEAYPDTTRITTKYNFPSQRPSQTPSEPSQPDQHASAAAAAATAPVASLTLKTFNPAAGICLKYRTNKAAEVGRLVTSLGKLAAGAGVAGLGLGPAATGAGAAGVDVEMGDAPGAVEEGAVSASAAASAPVSGKAEAGAKGGKGKKKGGKGKR